jgi:branched-chain amino acid transport system substrate-binding protein
MAIALLATACNVGASAREAPITIGALYPLTGAQASTGVQEMQGVKTAVELFNERGGVRGRAVQLNVVNAPDVETGWIQAHKLAATGVPAIIGAYGSTISLAASEVAHRKGVLYWETGAVADLVTSRGYPEVFRTGPSGSILAAQAARFAIDELAPRFGIAASKLRIAVVYENDPYGSSIGTGLRAESKRLGFPLIGSFGYDPMKERFDGIVPALARLKPDVVVAATYLHDGALLRDKLVAARVPMKALIGKCAAFYMPEMGKLLGDKVDGIFVADKPQHIASGALRPEARTLEQTFRARYQKRYGMVPDAPAYMGFSGAWAFLTGVLADARTFSLQDLRRAALAIDLPEGSLVNGAGVRFAGPRDAMPGQNMRALGVVWQWQNGSPVLVYPRAAARGTPQLASR